LEENASFAEIEKVYRQLYLRYHSREMSEEERERFPEISTAYKKLFDQEKEKNFPRKSKGRKERKYLRDSQLKSEIIETKRVVKVTKGGRRFSFTNLSLLWDERENKVAFSYLSYNATKIFIKRTPPGSGIKAGSLLNSLLKCLKFKDVSAKIIGSRNKLNVMRAAFLALDKLTETTRENFATDEAENNNEIKSANTMLGKLAGEILSESWETRDGQKNCIKKIIEEEVESAKKRVPDVSSNNAFIKELEKTIKTQETAEDKIAEKETELASLRSDLETANKEISKKKKEIETLTTEKLELNSQIAVYEEGLREVINEGETSLTDWKNKIQRKVISETVDSEELNSLRKKISELETRIDVLVREKNDEIDKASKAKNSQGFTIRELQKAKEENNKKNIALCFLAVCLVVSCVIAGFLGWKLRKVKSVPNQDKGGLKSKNK
ncbi:13373_t:CDS:2, partial [Gigaspora margarita]